MLMNGNDFLHVMKNTGAPRNPNAKSAMHVNSQIMEGGWCGYLWKEDGVDTSTKKRRLEGCHHFTRSHYGFYQII
jgi:hypothetical protein